MGLLRRDFPAVDQAAAGPAVEASAAGVDFMLKMRWFENMVSQSWLLLVYRRARCLLVFYIYFRTPAPRAARLACCARHAFAADSFDGLREMAATAA